MSKYGEIGGRLRLVRGKTTQADFADALDIALLTYQRYERGERVPPGEVLTRAAEIGRTSIDWILTGKDKTTKKKGVFVFEDSAEYEVFKMVQALPKDKVGMAKSILKAMLEEGREKG